MHTINVQPVLTDASNGNTLTSSAKRSSTQKPDSSRNTFSKMPVLLLVPPLPSQPKSDVTLIKGNIVLSWNMEKASATPIVKYEICSYLVEDLQHVTSKDPWRCVATFEATRLPMACSLMEFQPGLTYCFAVRAIDIYDRRGPLSSPNKVKITNDTDEKDVKGKENGREYEKNKEQGKVTVL